MKPTLHPIPWLRISCSTSPGLLWRCDHFLGEWALCPLGLCKETGLSLFPFPRAPTSLPPLCWERPCASWTFKPLCWERPCASWTFKILSPNGGEVEEVWKYRRSFGLFPVFLGKLQSEKCLQTLSSNLLSLLLPKQVSALVAEIPSFPGGNSSLPAEKWNFILVSLPICSSPLPWADQLMLLFLILNPCLIFSTQWRLHAKLLLFLKCCSALGVAFICHRVSGISRLVSLLGSG